MSLIKAQKTNRQRWIIGLGIPLLLFITITQAIAIYDFSGDNKQGKADLLILAEEWLKTDSIADIYPPPHGDGIVNYGDFAEFSKYWNPPAARTLSAYEQFAELSESIDPILADIQDKLGTNQDIYGNLALLQEIETEIERLSIIISDEYEQTLIHCQNHHLDQDIIQRGSEAKHSFLETKDLILNTILNILIADETTLPVLIPSARDILASVKLTMEPGIHNSQPSIWRIKSLQDIPVAQYDPSIPAVDVMAAASLTPPAPMDLQETLDVQITDEIVAKAEDFGHSPSAMYEFVRNTFKFQPYYGSWKGSVETLRQRGGNDYDLATILIALLRASGINARYASGIVEIPVDRAKSWLGVDDGRVAGGILTTEGMEGVSILDGQGNVVSVRCRRVWVEAYVSRGRGGPVWVPLDPAFKLHDIQQGVDVPDLMNFDVQNFVDEYYAPTDPSVTLPRQETLLELFKQEITDYLAEYYPEETVESVKRKSSIISEDLGLLPASLPYKVLSRDGSFSEIPDNKVYKIRFLLKNGAATLIDHTMNLPEIAGKRITISYIGATQADQDTIDSYNGLLFTPPYLVNVKPVLIIGGQPVSTGSGSVGAGRTHNCTVYFQAPVNTQGYPQNVTPLIANDIIAGEYQSIGLSVCGGTNPLLNPPYPDDTEDFRAQLRYATAMGYLNACNAADDEFGDLMHVKVTRDVDNAILQDQITVTQDMWGNPNSWTWKGLTVDADRKIIGVWKVDGLEGGCGGKAKDHMIISGAEGSLYENVIFEGSFDKEAVSTIKILQLASQQGITVYKRWSSTTLPGDVVLPTYIRNAIISAISQGNEVTFPARQVTYHNWTGVGYIDMDPCTGAAGYIIAGGQNGGSTVDEWTDLVPVEPGKTVDYIEGDVTVPPQDKPHIDALYYKGDTNSMHFEYQLRVHYKDGGGTGDWQTYSHNSPSPSSLSTGNYVLTVGDQGSDHQRQLAIYDFTGKLTPQDNFSGRSQDKYGIEELVALTTTFDPTGITVSQIGGLEWTINSGVGAVSNAGNDGTADYHAKETAGNVAFQLTIKSGRYNGQNKSYSKTVITPNSAYMIQAPGTGIWHIQNTASVGFKGHIYLEPKDVSFNHILFSEGTCNAIASGFYAYQNNDVHPATIGRVPVGLGNINKGCHILGTDTIEAAPKGPPYSEGDFLWPIPWRYQAGTSNDIPFYTANQHKTADSNGKCSYEKAGAGPFYKNANDPSSNY